MGVVTFKKKKKFKCKLHMHVFNKIIDDYIC